MKQACALDTSRRCEGSTELKAMQLLQGTSTGGHLCWKDIHCVVQLTLL